MNRKRCSDGLLLEKRQWSLSRMVADPKTEQVRILRRRFVLLHLGCVSCTAPPPR